MKKKRKIEIPDCQNCKYLIECLPFGDKTGEIFECKTITIEIK